MTDLTSTRPDQRPIPNDPGALHAGIEDTRARLGETVDELGHRLDVRTRLKDAAQGTAHRVSDAGHRVGEITRRRPVMLAGGGVALAAAAGTSVLAWRRWRR